MKPYTNYVFPRAWGAWLEAERGQIIKTPVGLTCQWCDETIGSDDWGVCQLVLGTDPYFAPVHRECMIRRIVGSANHQLKLCSCFGGEANEDPPELTRRQAALLAMRLAGRQAE